MEALGERWEVHERRRHLERKQKNTVLHRHDEMILNSYEKTFVTTADVDTNVSFHSVAMTISTYPCIQSSASHTDYVTVLVYNVLFHLCASTKQKSTHLQW